MNPFKINPADINEELSRFSRKLTEGLSTLREMGEPETAGSDKQCVYEEDKLRLYHFAARTEEAITTPVIIVYALVNRPYVADLQEDRSFIRGLLDAGLDIYLIDWGYPDAGDSSLELSDYINRYIHNCVNYICKEHDLKEINMLGICQGGVFSLCYSALYPGKIANLITTVTPVDFHTDKDRLSNIVRHVDIDLCVDTFGNLPGSFLNWVFLSLKPHRLMGQKYVDMVDILDDEIKIQNFVRMEKWIFDSPDQAAGAFRQFVKQFYQENSLIRGAVEIDDKIVDLKNIRIPVLNVYAEEDHLVPPESSQALAACIGTEDYRELAVPGGHIGIYVSRKNQSTLSKDIGNWLKHRD